MFYFGLSNEDIDLCPLRIKEDFLILSILSNLFKNKVQDFSLCI